MPRDLEDAVMEELDPEEDDEGNESDSSDSSWSTASTSSFDADMEDLECELEESIVLGLAEVESLILQMRSFSISNQTAFSSSSTCAEPASYISTQRLKAIGRTSPSPPPSHRFEAVSYSRGCAHDALSLSNQTVSTLSQRNWADVGRHATSPSKDATQLPYHPPTPPHPATPVWWHPSIYKVGLILQRFKRSN
ncbi:hypothetical protein L211DRAFT_853358 [Terfezia boudieri ATCC MYA-4762]|uniref:Uncharacterized protein n=1 Tax=Terfezia boudieri ATCC MYA-4762 TaxID=1051890 RepID=A0A3N4L8Q9_9PEZI|nr:hypothetical protein L211DRAFT_853358 [Terfezia boudieri ATCC MYA-4762]